jgi:photosystem II stability/assembly factor-like uncharacterized protein
MDARRIALAAASIAGLATLAPQRGVAAAAHVEPALFAAMHWRMIGPFRGGREVAVSGVVGDPRIAYFGAVGGGVWKTENAGRTWAPLMDQEPVASIGAIAVAPSSPATIYVGSGEADMRSDIIHGNGMYVSHDAGRSWSHSGLVDSRQIGRILVDPHDPKTLLVAALGHAYGPNDERGVYRSTDGGATWQRTLFLNRDTGAIDLAADPAMHTVFASLWQTRRPPWSVYPPSNGPGSGLYVSHDGGVTWTNVRGSGIPVAGLGKIGLAVAPSDPQRVYAVLDAKAGGVYRSDDGGATWRLIDADRRLWGRGWYFCHIAVDPKNPDLVYLSNTSFYRSTDGGAHFTAIKGSPDGDDFHGIWVDPDDGNHVVLGSDQGTSISLDGAKTWSSWFNQPTGQFYTISTDDTFPFHIFGSQQDSGAAVILSRSDNRGIEERDWRPLAAGGESNTVIPDPLDAEVLFGGFVDRESLRTNQTRSVSPVAGKPGSWRAEWTMPLVFGPGHALYASRQMIFRTRDDGDSWQQISGDLSRPHPGIPPNLDAPAAADFDGSEPRGVVYSIAPSPTQANLVWAGTDDGLVYVTHDAGGTWDNVTPKGIPVWSHIDGIETSRFDAGVAYVAVDRHRLDDDHPYIYVTRDGGRTWSDDATGIGPASFVWTLREDPARRGLLFAGTETGVFVSFDDAASWQPLHMNMPVTPVHALAIRGDTLVAGTHGRAIWVLDDITPLRQLAADPSPDARLFSPETALRTRPRDDQAEASPPETPLGENREDGAFIDYVVPTGAHGPVTLTIAGPATRRFSSRDVAQVVDPNSVEFPAYWLTEPSRLSEVPGMHRFAWDMHVGDADGPWAPPGTYALTLTVAGRTFERTLLLRKDPRVSASDAELRAQYDLATQIAAVSVRVGDALAAAAKLRAKTGADTAAIDAIAGAPPDRGNPFAPPSSLTTLRFRSFLLDDLFSAVESADAAPSAEQRDAWQTLSEAVAQNLAAWNAYAAAHP